jgi:hypothetical protein
MKKLIVSQVPDIIRLRDVANVSHGLLGVVYGV